MLPPLPPAEDAAEDALLAVAARDERIDSLPDSLIAPPVSVNVPTSPVHSRLASMTTTTRLASRARGLVPCVATAARTRVSAI